MYLQRRSDLRIPKIAILTLPDHTSLKSVSLIPLIPFSSPLSSAVPLSAHHLQGWAPLVRTEKASIHSGCKGNTNQGFPWFQETRDSTYRNLLINKHSNHIKCSHSSCLPLHYDQWLSIIILFASNPLPYTQSLIIVTGYFSGVNETRTSYNGIFPMMRITLD